MNRFTVVDEPPPAMPPMLGRRNAKPAFFSRNAAPPLSTAGKDKVALHPDRLASPSLAQEANTANSTLKTTLSSPMVAKFAPSQPTKALHDKPNTTPPALVSAATSQAPIPVSECLASPRLVTGAGQTTGSTNTVHSCPTTTTLAPSHPTKTQEQSLTTAPGMMTTTVTKIQNKMVGGERVTEATTVKPVNKPCPSPEDQGWGGTLSKKLERNHESKQHRQLVPSEMNTVMAATPEMSEQANTQVPKVATMVVPAKQATSRIPAVAPVTATLTPQPAIHDKALKVPGAIRSVQAQQGQTAPQPVGSATVVRVQKPTSTSSTDTPTMVPGGGAAPSTSKNARSNTQPVATASPRCPLTTPLLVSTRTAASESLATAPTPAPRILASHASVPPPDNALNAPVVSPRLVVTVATPAPSCAEPVSMSTSSHLYNTTSQEAGPSSSAQDDPTDLDFVQPVIDDDECHDDDASANYDEISILDDEIYEITYYEDETVLDESEHKRGMQQFAPSSAPPLPLPQIKLVGMDVLMANIRTRVPVIE
jgi:hypothetical protein